MGVKYSDFCKGYILPYSQRFVLLLCFYTENFQYLEVLYQLN
ncbi:hypothetical protein J699_03179 [Acinetobacter sp. 1000160]|nr:hypothetical protein J522_3451 [Acinetobacter baumannii 146457]EYT16405.1 hypothetical protein J699_03179 [Acinetobacter sp. 1000160]